MLCCEPETSFSFLPSGAEKIWSDHLIPNPDIKQPHPAFDCSTFVYHVAMETNKAFISIIGHTVSVLHNKTQSATTSTHETLKSHRLWVLCQAHYKYWIKERVIILKIICMAPFSTKLKKKNPIKQTTDLVRGSQTFSC